MMHEIFNTYRYLVGVDPGYGCTGLVVLGPGGTGIDLIIGRAYTSDSKLCREERTHRLMLDVITKAYSVTLPCKDRPVLLAIEDNHFTGGKSAQNALLQRELIGHMAASAWQYGFEVARVAPTTAKKALTGSGKADKLAMVAAATVVPGCPSGLARARIEAVADALGIALAGGGIKHGEWA